MQLFWLFASGMLLCNAIPHVVAGLQGNAFPTPFATPRGIGNSPPLLNFVWGSANLAAGTALALWRLPATASSAVPVAIGGGFLVAGLYLSWHFGRGRGQRGGRSTFDE